MANTFKNAVTGSSTSLGAFYTCPASTTAVVHAVYLSNVDGVNDETINLSVSGSANFNDRKYILDDNQNGVLVAMLKIIMDQLHSIFVAQKDMLMFI